MNKIEIDLSKYTPGIYVINLIGTESKKTDESVFSKSIKSMNWSIPDVVKALNGTFSVRNLFFPLYH